MQKQKPQLSFWQIWNMCFGFMGIQFGFALQNGNVSRIFQTLGASVDDIPILWVAAPLTGLIVQPIIGYWSDRTWTGLGRRRPFFLYGAILTTLSLFIMPNSPTLWIAAGMLWIMDASINVTMEPFRALVGDNLNKKQRATGYAMQSFFIGIGAIIASALPWMMTNWFGISNTAAPGEIPESVKYAFYFGGVILFLAVGWTILKTKEYTPEQLAEFESPELKQASSQPKQRIQFAKFALVSGAIGGLILAGVTVLKLEKELYLLSALLLSFSAIILIAGYLQNKQRTSGGFYEVIYDVFTMPETMRQLAVVQFFSWFSLFAMWIYTTSAVTSFHYGTTDVTSKAYNDGADWVGILFAAYNGFAALAAVCIPFFVKHVGLKWAHSLNLLLGAGALLSFLFISDPSLLWLPMIGIGFAWASILSLPYAMLSDAVPAHKMGVFMGIFNFFIVIPQLLAASVLGLILRNVFENQPIYALVIGGVSFILAALSVARVKTSAQ
ncbi:MFS transporter [Pseudoalteromonas luteoviolacea]|uniref:MFS transporter n=1 Tax=Pseudoalteromonas luteoviolacea S4054 TaxID=1129367 RepID=A0A0F6A594_9GAMM|nr:MFS transporter [Pseudoalteromonas luteoviolacea]AOT07617.1 MFS transporter [Pseudoalteromonas luteoviolacea]AOT12533.1 MFS transporter [Pseudoalteromonas luteoviolacea]AOT17447.1 MFS transporter [Pseudoalteromonas luteoviolacea]KKE81357.1 MFS transporter [Pseudoalteromonas luteoviolacea S4054]KZN70634.1 MFS transporter [Pseudoalteromonas luteoviolacea S4047-1]